MARVYYHEEKLNGRALESKVINLSLFDFIFSNTDTDRFEIQTILNTSFFKLFKFKQAAFKTVLLWRDGFHYNSTEGNFYLPESIIFYDYDDHIFPSEFYFIAKLSNQLEIRKCHGGEKIEWHQIPSLHTEVTDTRIITKIENTLLEVKKLVETTHNKPINLDRAKKKAEEIRKIEESRPYLNETQKNAYIQLIEMCIKSSTKKKNATEFIETLKDHDYGTDNKYYITLNYVINFLEQHKIAFISRLDWKADIDDLEWILKSVLQNNYDLSITLPNPSNYAENASISSDNVLMDFNQSLKENGFQIGFIDTQSDEYIMLLHKITDKEQIEKALQAIGCHYSKDQ